MKIFIGVLGWVLAVLLAVVFIFAGGIKLIGKPAMVQEFAQIGAGQWFRYCTGLLEVIGGTGLLVPRYRFWAALQLAAIMAGATAVNIVILHTPPLARVTVLLMTLALVLAWTSRSREV